MPANRHFAAPLLLFVILGLIVYVSLYPFEFATGRPGWLAALDSMTWARASRSDMFNNVLLYAPLGFCLALLVEPRTGRLAALPVVTLAGGVLSLTLELLQASIESRVPSYTDLALNTAGTLAGAIAGSAWHAFGTRIAPADQPASHSRTVILTIAVLWLLTRLWPLVPELGLSQVKQAVRPLFEPRLSAPELTAFFIGWLIVAQTLVHVSRRQRGVDVLLMMVAAVLVGRTLVAGSTLVFAEIVAIALVVPALVPLSRMSDRTRCGWLAALLVAWLLWLVIAPVLHGGATFAVVQASIERSFLRPPPAPQQIFGKTFNYLALGWLLVSAGILPHVAAGLTFAIVAALCLLQLGVPFAGYGWTDLAIAALSGVMIARWMPTSQPRPRAR